MKRQGGFTLIELVVVIVILGLLAATALPRFISVTDDARIASLNGIAGGLRSAISLARAQYVVNGVNGATTITMDTASVAVLDETTYAGRGGRPTCAGMGNAMPDPSDYTIDSACAAVGTVRTYRPQGGSATCQVAYDPDIAAPTDPVTVTTAGC